MLHPSDGRCCPRMPLVQTRAQSVSSLVGQLPAYLGEVGALWPAGQEVQQLLGVVQLMACLHPTNTRDTEAGVATCDLPSSPAHLGPDEFASRQRPWVLLHLSCSQACTAPAWPDAAPARCRLLARMLLFARWKLGWAAAAVRPKHQGCAF